MDALTLLVPIKEKFIDTFRDEMKNRYLKSVSSSSRLSYLRYCGECSVLHSTLLHDEVNNCTTHGEKIIRVFSILHVNCKNKICLKITVLVLESFMHKQSLKIRTHLCWKFNGGLKNNSDNRRITAAVCSWNLLYMWSIHQGLIYTYI